MPSIGHLRGVVNEYLNDYEVLRSGRRQTVPAMSELERVVIGGVDLEAAHTSGGLGTMCQTYEGRVQRLDYKTMRYPGHFSLMRFFFDELDMRSQPEVAGEILVEGKPLVDDDVVYLYAAVEGEWAAQSRVCTASSTYAPISRWRSTGRLAGDLGPHGFDSSGR